MPGPRASEAERKEQILEAALQVAMREGLENLSTRKVAAEARLSQGLVFFHFESKAALLLALLVRLLERTAAPQVDPELLQIAAPAQRLVELLRRDVARFLRERASVQLFFDYWVMGAHSPPVRDLIRQALARYRKAYEPIAEAIALDRKERLPALDPQGLTAVMVSLIQGCAVQAVIDPEGFDLGQFTSTAEDLLDLLK